MRILKNGEYYGKLKTEIRTKDYILSEYSYDIPSTDWHYHEDPYFMYLLDGKVYDVNRKNTKRCSQGTLLFHNWDDKHYNAKHSKNARGFHIEINRKNLNQFIGDRKPIEGSFQMDNPNAHIILGKLYNEFKIQDAFSKIGIDSLITNLINSLEIEDSINSTIPKWLGQLTEIILEENEITSLVEFSNILGIHPVHISRTFPKYYGCTLSEYIRLIKIKKSIPLIIEGKQNLTQIAHHCGFTDQSHFSRTFKYYYSLSPRAYKLRIS